MIIITLSIVFLLVAFVGVTVWLRNPWHVIYQTFLGTTLSGALWILTNIAFQLTGGSVQFISALVSYGSVGLFASFFVGFSLALTNSGKHIRSLLLLGIILSVLFSLPNVLAMGVSNNSILTTPLLILYAIWLVLYFSIGIIQLVKGKKGLAERRQQQIKSVINGIIITFVFAGICNLLLPLFGNYEFVALGPAFSLVFIMFFAYTIIKHQLFDIKRTLARLVVYTMSVGVLGGVLGYISYLLIQITNAEATLGIFILAGLFISALFPVAKNLFDYLTKQLFFSNEYDIQKAIDKMTLIFSSSSTLDQLIKRSCKELATILDATDVKITYENNPILLSHAHSLGRAVVIKDYLDDLSSSEKVTKFMSENNIAMYTPLIVSKKAIGLLCIGDKANGSSYNTHDMEFVDIVSDELAIAIQNAQRLEEIKHFNEELQARIKDATTELRGSNKKLRQIDASKDEFISMASHQLRTPLTSIKGYISMILDGDLGEIKPEQRKALEEAYDSSQRMVYLIGDFLNLSRIQTGRFELELTPVNLPLLLDEEIEQLKQSAKARHVTLLYDEPADFPTLSIDETKIRQVMMNFIDNAIYYAKPEGGEILIVLEKQRDEVIFRVKDNGIGVPAQARKQLFSKFFRADNAKKARPDGTGIGLYMSKRVVVAHGGEIIFESKEGEGSEFGFRLPIK